MCEEREVLEDHLRLTRLLPSDVEEIIRPLSETLHSQDEDQERSMYVDESSAFAPQNVLL